MNNYQSNALKIIGVYQILGGCFGLINTGIIIFKRMPDSIVIMLIYIIITCCFFSFSILCGRLLFKNVQRGLKYTLINQYLQLINFWIAGYAFKYVSGVYIGLGFNWTDTFTFDIEFGTSRWMAILLYGAGYRFIGINIVALLLIILIRWLVRKKHNKIHFTFESERDRA